MTPRVLVVDGEYLIAMDAEQILTTGLRCEVTISSPANCPAHLGRKDFDTVVLDIGADLKRHAALIDGLVESRVPIVFSTTCVDYADGLPGLCGYPVVLKPYGDGNLVAAVQAALERYVLPT
ncbi:MAG: hypothetical protein C0606_05995 [Hyphomicrobiales bacterium]|nr:MAG: hypothetical protein C0606_05995 [Hyphomicrobiales bacterium]